MAHNGFKETPDSTDLVRIRERDGEYRQTTVGAIAALGGGGGGGGGGEPLTYPAFTWNQYTGSPYHEVAGGTGDWVPPLTTGSGATAVNPAGWTITDGELDLPDGVYAVTWYWESDDSGTFWDNYAVVDGTGLGTTIWPVAPMAQPNSFWGSCSFTVKLENSPNNSMSFYISNIDASPHSILNLITITRMDA